jgi:NAD(P)-dependent dehydrogenase (short-subunit alcohol dehydrogenase family)
MFANTSEEEFDAVIAVHLKGHFATMRHAAAYWRAQSKAGNTPDARIINTSSGAGLQGSVGQANYSASKAGIAALTLVAAAEMGRYGVTVNAIAPRAATRLMAGTFGEVDPAEEAKWAPEHVASFVGFLCSAAASDVTGQVFVVHGGSVALARPWQIGAELDVAGASDEAVRSVLDGAFGDDPPGIPDFRIGEDYPGGGS